jgi:Flp pilus assembly protein TadG
VGDDGSIAPAVPILALMILLLGGLVVDGSRQLNARGRAVAYAEEAARAGASAVDLAKTDLVLDETEAQLRVDDYCARVLGSGEVTECAFLRIEEVGPDDPRPIVVRTRVRLQIQAGLLNIVGVSRLTAGAEARARPYEGVTGADAK